MKLDKKNILHLANLAKLELSEAEIKTYGKQLEEILAYVDKINELDLEKIKESLTGVEELKLVPRPDNSVKSESVAINQAGRREKGYVVAPNVFDK